ncbi:MAG: hypothetical protein U0821_09435 [Chloroflexota bacterium]
MISASTADSRLTFEVREELRRVTARAWRETALPILARALAVGAALVLVVAAAAWLADLGEWLFWWWVPAAAALAYGIVDAALSAPTTGGAARLADRRFGLGEQLGTAVELLEGREHGPIERLQLASARAVAQTARQNWHGGPSATRPLILAAALALLAAGLLIPRLTVPRAPTALGQPPAIDLPSPRAAENPRVPTPVLVPNAPSPTSPRAAAIANTINTTRRDRESGAIGADEAGRRLSAAARDLAGLAADAARQREALDRLASELSGIGASRAAAEAIQAGDYQRAGNEISSLGRESDQLSQQARSQLGQALQTAAADQRTTPRLANAERRAGEAIQRPDYESARASMESLGEQVARSATESATPSELAGLREQLDREARAQGQAPMSGQTASTTQRAPQSASRGGAGQPGNNPGAQEGTRPADQGAFSGGSQPGSSPGAEPADTGEAPPRLETAGRPVEIDALPSGGPRRESNKNDPAADEVGRPSVVTSAGPGGRAASAPAEPNLVPPASRDLVRGYFGPDAPTTGGRR